MVKYYFCNDNIIDESSLILAYIKFIKKQGIQNSVKIKYTCVNNSGSFDNEPYVFSFYYSDNKISVKLDNNIVCSNLLYFPSYNKFISLFDYTDRESIKHYYYSMLIDLFDDKKYDSNHQIENYSNDISVPNNDIDDTCSNNSSNKEEEIIDDRTTKQRIKVRNIDPTDTWEMMCSDMNKKNTKINYERITNEKFENDKKIYRLMLLDFEDKCIDLTKITPLFVLKFVLYLYLDGRNINNEKEEVSKLNYSIVDGHDIHKLYNNLYNYLISIKNNVKNKAYKRSDDFFKDEILKLEIFLEQNSIDVYSMSSLSFTTNLNHDFMDEKYSDSYTKKKMTYYYVFDANSSSDSSDNESLCSEESYQNNTECFDNALKILENYKVDEEESDKISDVIDQYIEF